MDNFDHSSDAGAKGGGGVGFTADVDMSAGAGTEAKGASGVPVSDLALHTRAPHAASVADARHVQVRGAGGRCAGCCRCGHVPAGRVWPR